MVKKKKARPKTRREAEKPTKLLYLDEGEVKELIEAAGQIGRHRERDQAMILIAFHHGMRASELCRLRWERVYIDREQLYVTRCKGSESGMHFLYPDDVIAFKKLEPERTGYVFRSEAIKNPGPMSPAGFHAIVKRAGRAARLGANTHPHQLRHACGYWMHKEGFDIREIQRWLGHKNIQNTAHYTALDTNAIFEKWKKLQGEKA